MTPNLRRHCIAVAALSALALTAAGCGRPATSSSGSDSRTVVGFSAGYLDNPFNSGLVKAVVNEANSTKSGLKMLPATDAQSDTAKQISDVNTLLSRGVKALVLTPQDSDAIVPAVKAANAKNVPVVTTDVAANGGKVYMNIRADNVLMGRQVCEQMGQLVGGTGTVLEIHGDLGTSSGFDRAKGFDDCMKTKFPNVKVISKDSKWKTDTAVNVAQTVLSTTKVAGVFLASDSVMLDGIETVMKDRNLLVKTGQSGHVPLVTIDGSTNALQGIRDGYVDAVISQPVDLYGKYAVQYMKDALAGKTYQAGPTDHDSTIVEYKGNLADMLPSAVVTSKNVDDTSLWGNFS